LTQHVGLKIKINMDDKADFCGFTIFQGSLVPSISSFEQNYGTKIS
jgi:hypothetical protein